MKPRLLFLAQCLPYPPHSGVANRTFHILCELQRAFDVHLVAFSRRNHQPDRDAREAAAAALRSRLTRVYEPTPIPSERGVAARVWCHWRSVLTARPYVRYEYASAHVRRTLRHALRNAPPDLIHLDSLDLYAWLADLPPKPVAVTHHSIESELLRLRAQHMKSALLRSYLRLQAHWVEGVERQYCSQVALNVMMSDLDANRLRHLAPGTRTVTVPNGVDVDYFRFAEVPSPTPKRVIFLGPTYMYPNKDAVRFFLNEVWTRIRTEVPDATFHLIGKMPDADRAQFEGRPGVTCHGYVPDIRPYFAGAACSVVPIRIGGGTRLKILDSWAMGRAVVSTTVGCEGLKAVDGENILIRDEPEAFARAVIRVLTDEPLRRQLAEAGRATVERFYSWRAIGDHLIGAYRALLATPTPSAAATRLVPELS